MFASVNNSFGININSNKIKVKILIVILNELDNIIFSALKLTFSLFSLFYILPKKLSFSKLGFIMYWSL